jgi:hypothetical protein
MKPRFLAKNRAVFLLYENDEIELFTNLPFDNTVLSLTLFLTIPPTPRYNGTFVVKGNILIRLVIASV